MKLTDGQYLTVREAALECGRSRVTVWTWIHKGKLRATLMEAPRPWYRINRRDWRKFMENK